MDLHISNGKTNSYAMLYTSNIKKELCNFHCVYEYKSDKKSHYEHISNFLYKATGSNMNACKHYVKLK
jgi:hypothetical protein